MAKPPMENGRLGSPAQKVAKWPKGAKWSNSKSMANYASAKMIKLKHFIYNMCVPNGLKTYRV